MKIGTKLLLFSFGASLLLGCAREEEKMRLDAQTEEKNHLKNVGYSLIKETDLSYRNLREGVDSLYQQFEASDGEPNDMYEDLEESRLVRSNKIVRMLSRVALMNHLTLNVMDRCWEKSSAEKGTRATEVVGFEDASMCKIIKYNYDTKDQCGNPITLSSIVAIPAFDESDELELNWINLDCHYTITSNKECPSLSAPYTTYLAAEDNVMVVCPDYQGFGITANRSQLYLCEEVGARQCLDAVRAAVALLKEKYNLRLKEDYYTQITGYSQGGAMAVAVTRAIEQLSESDKSVFDFKLQKTLCGGGPYDPTTTLKIYFDRNEVAYPVAGPLILKGQIEGNPDLFQEVEYEDYLTDKYKNSGIDEMYGNGKLYTTDELNKAIKQRMGSMKLTDIFRKDLFDSTQADYKKLREPLDKALAKNNLLGGEWRPTHPIWIFHCSGDEVVPVENFDLAVEKFSTNTEVHTYKTFFSWWGHTQGGYGFYIAILGGTFINWFE